MVHLTPAAGDEPAAGPSPGPDRADAIRGTLRLLRSLGREQQAREPDRAAACFRQAADLARDLDDPDEEIEALVSWGALESRRGRLSEAEPALLRALDLSRRDREGAPAPLLLASALNAIGYLRIRQGRLDDALQFLRESLPHTTSTDLSGRAGQARAETLEFLGAAYAHQGDPGAALRHHEEALELRRAASDPAGAARNENQLGNLRHRLGRYAEAAESYRRALEVFRSLDDARVTAAIANNLASTLLRLGETEEARNLFEECRSHFAALGETARVADVLSNLGLLAQGQGRVEEAEGHYLESLRLRRESEDLLGESHSLTNLAHLSLLRDRLDEAVARAGESVALLRRCGSEETLSWPLGCRGIAVLELGRPTEAVEALREARDAVRRTGASDQRAECLLLEARLRTASGRRDEAAAAAAEGLMLAEETGDPELIAAAHRYAAAALLDLGELEQAKERLARAGRLLRGWESSFERACVYLEEGRLHLRTGADDAAAERLRRAEAVFLRIGNQRWRLRALLLLAEALRGSPRAAEVRGEAEELARMNGLGSLLSPAGETPVRPGLAEPGDGEPAGVTAAVGRMLDALAALGRDLEECVRTSEADPALLGGAISRFLSCLPGAAGVEVLLRGATTTTGGVSPSAAENTALLERPVSAGGQPLGIVRWRGPSETLSPTLSTLVEAGLHEAALSWALLRDRKGNRPAEGSFDLASDRFELLVGTSRPMRALYDLLSQAAPTDSTVLILGESGTGKELVARSLHHLSLRRDHPFVPINCPSIPRDLLESELFGHERGAFTGATESRPGKIELADRGTLFLDEVGDLPFSVQAKLLRFLQEREFERVGGRRSIRVDVRLVAATSRDLEAALSRGEFREDLYYRLHVVPVRVPPLRDRPEDVPMLAGHFLASLARPGQPARRLTAGALDRLLAHDWPGNVRELRNTIEYLLTVGGAELLEERHLPPGFLSAPPAGSAATRTPNPTGMPGASAPSVQPGETLESRLMQVEASLLRAALEEVSWNQSAAARRLGITESRMRQRMRRYGLRRPTDGTPRDQETNVTRRRKP